MPNYVKNILSFDGDPAQVDRLFIYTIQLTEAQYAALLDRAAELEIGVVVVFEEQGIDTAQMLGEMQLTLLAMAAQEESTSISKNVRWSYQKRMENGEFITTYAPFGYRLEKGVLIPEPEEARVVCAIFTLFLSGRGALASAGQSISAGQSLPGAEPHDAETVCHRPDRGRAGTGRGPVSGQPPGGTGG